MVQTGSSACSFGALIEQPEHATQPVGHDPGRDDVAVHSPPDLLSCQRQLERAHPGPGHVLADARTLRPELDVIILIMVQVHFELWPETGLGREEGVPRARDEAESGALGLREE